MLILLSASVALVRHKSPLEIWNQWDTVWYVGIAQHGYTWGLHGRSALAFFPLFPALIHLTTPGAISPLVSGLLISNGAFLGALLYLCLLAQAYWEDPIPSRLLLIMALAPTAFFTFAPYTESLFLLCAAGTLYHAQRQNALATGLWLAGAFLTRSTGVILVIPVLLMMRQRRLGTLCLTFLPALLGWAAFLLYLRAEHISWHRLLDVQRGWHRGFGYPWVGFTSSLHWIMAHGSSNLPWAFEDGLQLTVTGVFIALTVWAWHFLPAALRMYCLGFWVVVLPAPQWLDGFYAPFSSMDRFVLVLFPLAAWIAYKASERGFRLGMSVSAVTLAATCTVHLAGGWVG